MKSFNFKKHIDHSTKKVCSKFEFSTVIYIEYVSLDLHKLINYKNNPCTIRFDTTTHEGSKRWLGINNLVTRARDFSL